MLEFTSIGGHEMYLEKVYSIGGYLHLATFLGLHRDIHVQRIISPGPIE